MHCVHCGKRILGHSKFCPHCGTAVPSKSPKKSSLSLLQKFPHAVRIILILLSAIALFFLVNLFLSIHKSKCPDPVSCLSLTKIQTNHYGIPANGSYYGYFNHIYTSDWNTDTAWDAIESYKTIVEEQYGATATLTNDDTPYSRYQLIVDFGRKSLLDNSRRSFTLIFYPDNEQWYLSYWPSDGVKFISADSISFSNSETAVSSVSLSTSEVYPLLMNPPAPEDANSSLEDAIKATPEQEPESTLPSKAVSLADSIDLSGLRNVPRNAVQDIRFWSCGEIKFSDKPLNMGDYTIYYFKASDSQLSSYLDMLCESGFSLVDSHHGSSFVSGKRAEYALICNSSDAATIKGLYTKADCHIDIWWESGTHWRMEVADGLQYCDLGLRNDGTQTSIGPKGASVGAGLSYRSGVYSTDDGRLSTAMMSAALRSDKMEFTSSIDLECEGVGEYRMTLISSNSDKITLSWNDSEFGTNDIYLYSDFESGSPTLTITTGEESTTPKIKGYVRFNNLTLRVMYYEPDSEAVFYLYGESFDGSSFETLCAVDLHPLEAAAEPPVETSGATVIDVGENQTIHIKEGESVILRCIYTSTYDLGTAYTTYDWSQSGDAITSSSVYRECTVTGLKKGTATIDLVYHYTVKGNDVLTGLPRDQRETRSRTFQIVVE